MQRMPFLQQIQQKNDHCDFRKLSLQSISTNVNDQQKGLSNIEPPNYHSQMPAFINRKVKNLKPYTNHFKRFNVQATKIQQIGAKNKEVNKLIKVNLQNDKIKISKSSVLKQLGIERQIKPVDIGNKLSQVSVYDQFLEKTNTLLSSGLIQSMYQQCMKKNQKQVYQRSHRVNHCKQDRQKNKVPRQQRRSMGGVTQSNQMQISEGKKSIYGIKSMDQLPKSQEGIIRSDKVCIIPNLINIQNQDLGLNHGLKYVASLKKKKSLVQTAQSVRKEHNQEKKQKASKKIIVQNQKSSNIQENNIIENLPQKNIEALSQKEKNKINQYPVHHFASASPTKVSKMPKSSPSKQIKNAFISSNGFKQKQSQKNSQIQSFSQKEVTTINVDKNKLKLNPVDIPFPSNVTATSYIVYEPSFSQNNNFNSNEESLSYTNKIFSNQRILASLNCKSVLQIASLTKIMTFILALEICENLKIESTNQKVRIGKFESNINGTSAEIKQGEIYTVQQLYYGLMLPSGNDASLALATWGGKKMLIREIRQKEKGKKKSVSQIPVKSFAQTDTNSNFFKPENQKIVLKKKKCYDRFILQMNKKARCLGMTKTTYANSHGLANNLNKSCAFDLCILCEYAMMNIKFKKIVSTENYQSNILYEYVENQENKNQKQKIQRKEQEYEQSDDIEHDNENSDQQSSEQMDQKQAISSRQEIFYDSKTILQPNLKDINGLKPGILYKQKEISWQNTHKLLSRQDYIGIKTGITNTAGPCLASCIKTTENRFFIIIVLNSKKINYRFKDTETLRKWIYKRQGIAPIKMIKPETQSSLAFFKDDPQHNTCFNSENQLMQSQKHR